jgi:hypothetical protein
MASILKFPIGEPGAAYEALMPEGAAFVHAGLQHGARQSWWLVPEQSILRVTGVAPAPDAIGYETRLLCVIGTGPQWHVRDGARHLATWQEGAFVWHLFDVDPRAARMVRP